MATTRRVTGKSGVVTQNGVPIVEINEASIEVTLDFATSRGLGQMATARECVGYDASISITKYQSVGNIAQALAMAAATVQATDPLTIIVYDKLGGTKLIEGPFWAGNAGSAQPEADFATETLQFVQAGEMTSIGEVLMS